MTPPRSIVQTTRLAPSPTGALHLENVPRTVTKAYLLADHKPLKLTQNGKALAVTLPAKALDPIATVVVLETK